ncbi:uncharacterized protein LOC110173911 isoform X2 [Boleophthalmus pectinirostris]|uniref:uncharacterized protein LOC110173911 isoform X2 n=1 Tax=Boleophthalmus pectinirostris TaxID=150288 RepID=UPI00242ACFCE|nr:uncharacterized protein LOC110173911 isoform X2 [Boleophthalmus pectinirostris]
MATDNSPLFCIVCRCHYLRQGAHEHMHSKLHHRNLDSLMDKKNARRKQNKAKKISGPKPKLESNGASTKPTKNSAVNTQRPTFKVEHKDPGTTHQSMPRPSVVPLPAPPFGWTMQRPYFQADQNGQPHSLTKNPFRSTQASANEIELFANNAGGYCNSFGSNSNGGIMDFTSDHLPQDAGIIFESRSNPQSQKASQESRSQVDVATVTLEDSSLPAKHRVDMSVMIRQIHRELGLREPCRADREVRKQQVQAHCSQCNEPLQTTSAHVLCNAKDKGQMGTDGVSGLLKGGGGTGSDSGSGNGQKGSMDDRANVRQNLVSGARGKDWAHMCSEERRGRTRGLPRFGIELSRPPPPAQATFSHPEGAVSPLSEGELLTLSAQPLSAKPLSAFSSSTDPTPGLLQVTMDVLGDGEEKGNKRSKKRKQAHVCCEPGPSLKKTTISQNADQSSLDRLYSVSLMEEDLSLQLQELDKAIVQTRNTLQTYLILKEKCVAEVNSLRAQRIEILRTMREGLCNISNIEPCAPVPPAAPATSAKSVHPALPAPFTAPPVPTSSQCHPAQAKQKTYHTLLNVQNTTANVDTPVHLLSASDSPQPIPNTTTTTTAAAATTPTTTTTTTPIALTNQVPLQNPPVLNIRTQSQLPLVQCDSETRRAAMTTEETRDTSERAPPLVEDGDDSDDLEVMEPCPSVVINLDETNNEEEQNRSSAVKVEEEEGDEGAGSVALAPKEEIVDGGSPGSPVTQTQEHRNVEAAALPKTDTSSPHRPMKEEEPCVGAFEKHSGPVTALQIYDGLLYTCSGDHTARAYNLHTKDCVGVFEGHSNKVNCLLVTAVLTCLQSFSRAPVTKPSAASAPRQGGASHSCPCLTACSVCIWPGTSCT